MLVKMATTTATIGGGGFPPFLKFHPYFTNALHILDKLEIML
jgi:hypothetical protein